jgi:hypothetical protein
MVRGIIRMSPKRPAASHSTKYSTRLVLWSFCTLHLHSELSRSNHSKKRRCYPFENRLELNISQQPLPLFLGTLPPLNQRHAFFHCERVGKYCPRESLTKEFQLYVDYRPISQVLQFRVSFHDPQRQDPWHTPRLAKSI